MAASISTPQPSRSIIACRYIEVLCKQSRSQNDDLEEHVRRFELMSELVSREHVDMQKLLPPLLNGLPHQLVRFIHDHWWNQTLEWSTPDYQWRNPGPWPPRFEEALLYIKMGVESILGAPRLVPPGESIGIDKVLASLDIKKHPKSDPVENAKFDNLYWRLRTSTEEQIMATPFARFKLTPEVPSRPVSPTDSVVQLEIPPPTGSRGDKELHEGSAFESEVLPDEDGNLAVRIGTKVINFAATKAKGMLEFITHK